MIIMSVDVGTARTGVALSDKDEGFAFPKGVITEYNRERLIERLAQKAKELGAEMIVVGLPRNMDGSEGVRAEKSRRFKEMLEAECALPVVLWDERRSSIEAHAILHASGKKEKKHRKTVDAVAASLILEGYLGSI